MAKAKTCHINEKQPHNVIMVIKSNYALWFAIERQFHEKVFAF